MQRRLFRFYLFLSFGALTLSPISPLEANTGNDIQKQEPGKLIPDPPLCDLIEKGKLLDELNGLKALATGVQGDLNDISGGIVQSMVAEAHLEASSTALQKAYALLKDKMTEQDKASVESDLGWADSNLSNSNVMNNLANLHLNNAMNSVAAANDDLKKASDALTGGKCDLAGAKNSLNNAKQNLVLAATYGFAADSNLHDAITFQVAASDALKMAHQVLKKYT